MCEGMSLNGVAFDEQHINKHLKELNAAISQLEAKAHELAGHTFVLLSPMQVSQGTVVTMRNGTHQNSAVQ